MEMNNGKHFVINPLMMTRDHAQMNKNKISFHARMRMSNAADDRW